MFWAAIPHRIVSWEGEKPNFVVTLTLGWFHVAGLPESFAHAVLKGLPVSESKAMKGDEARFEHREFDLRTDEAARERVALLESQARLLRMAQPLPKGAKA